MYGRLEEISTFFLRSSSSRFFLSNSALLNGAGLGLLVFAGVSLFLFSDKKNRRMKTFDALRFYLQSHLIRCSLRGPLPSSLTSSQAPPFSFGGALFLAQGRFLARGPASQEAFHWLRGSWGGPVGPGRGTASYRGVS